MFTTAKATEVLERVVQEFEGADKVAEAVYKTIIRPPAGVPQRAWSWGNQLICALLHGYDCRGFRQWKKAGRSVRKGAKAVHILIPIIKEWEEEEKGEKVKKSKLVGFKVCPVFRAQDTNNAKGEPEAIEYPGTPEQLPDLARVAQALGCSVQYAPTSTGEYGYIDYTAREIVLSTPEESTLFHEIAHKIDFDLNGLPKGKDAEKDGDRRECVAEFAGNAIARIYGRKVNSKYTLAYIQSYSGKTGKDLGLYLYGILGRVAKIVARFAEIESETGEAVRVAE
jgi:hypothetical protein